MGCISHLFCVNIISVDCTLYFTNSRKHYTFSTTQRTFNFQAAMIQQPTKYNAHLYRRNLNVLLAPFTGHFTLCKKQHNIILQICGHTQTRFPDEPLLLNNHCALIFKALEIKTTILIKKMICTAYYWLL